MDLLSEVEKLVIDTLKKTVKASNYSGSKASSFIDKSTAPMGFSKITKQGYTP